MFKEDIKIEMFSSGDVAYQKPFLGKRYLYDGMPMKKMNSLQEKTKLQVEDKIKRGIYCFKNHPCTICGNETFTPLSYKERHGLFFPVVICDRCGLIQAASRMNEKSYDEFYDNEYRNLYGGLSAKDLFDKQYKKAPLIWSLIEVHGALVKPLSESFVFEVGCGAGGTLYYFKEKGSRVAGIDLGSEYLNFGKRNYGIDVRVSRINGVSFHEKPDIIIYQHVLEHISSVTVELSHIQRLLSNRGILYVALPGMKNIIKGHEPNFMRYLQNAHLYYFTLRTLRNLLEKNGFEYIFGNENIVSLFKKNSGYNSWIHNEYKEMCIYLKTVERLYAHEKYIKKPIRVLKKYLKVLLKRVYNLLWRKK